jgi:lipopolysaccharide biosynthesis glycosyltransferase
LWATDLASAPIGAVRNVVEAEMDAHVRALGLEPGAVFNSGVLLMDLAAMRAIGSVERLLSIGAERREQLWWPDQDVLNLGFAGAWRPLAARWNAQNSYYTLAELAANVVPAGELAEARDRPGIRHFEGPSTCKPWHYLTTSPHWREFRDALARTPWAGEAVLEDRTPATRLIRRLPQDRQLPVYRWWYRQRGLASRVRARAAAARGRVRRVDPHHSARG